MNTVIMILIGCAAALILFVAFMGLIGRINEEHDVVNDAKDEAIGDMVDIKSFYAKWDDEL